MTAPSSRTTASARQVSQLVGFLIHVSFVVRPGRFFVNRLLASVGMPRISAGADFGFRTANLGRRLVLGPEFQGNLEFWRWFIEEGLDARGGTLSAPMYHLLERPSQRTPFSDASKTAVGGSAFKLGCTGDTILTPGNDLDFAGRASQLQARTIDRLTSSNCWVWSSPPGSSYLRAPSARPRRGTACCSVATTKQP